MGSATEGRRPILVTGAAGMLGSYFQGERFLRTDRSSLDVCEKEKLRQIFERHRFSLILHFAALTNLEYCERFPEKAQAVNGKGTENLAALAGEFEIPLVYISTAGIFSGNPKEAYDEDDQPNPTSAYARSKYEGEQAVQWLAPRHLILRIGWLMGGFERDHKFVGAVLRRMRSSEAVGCTIPVVNDTRGSVLYAKDLHEIIWRLLRNRESLKNRPLMHIGNGGTCTRMELAAAIRDFIANRTGGDSLRSIELLPVSSAAYQNENILISRPKSEVLVSKHDSIMGQEPLRHWRLALEDYLSEWIAKH